MPDVDEVFRAINDSGRRRLLDALFERDGRTLGELTEVLPEMTRYGVMKHLKVLEDAALVTTLRRGRQKLHYLNPVPVRLVHDRWISKYAQHRVAGVAALATHIESNRQGDTMTAPDHVYTAYINAPASRVWEAITDPDLTQQYFYGTRVESTWQPGDAMNYRSADGGQLVSTGEIIAVDEPARLEFTFHALWDPALEAEGPVREIWSLDETAGMTRLTIEVHGAPAGSRTLTDFSDGFPYIVSGLKTLVETGASLPAPAPAT